MDVSLMPRHAAVGQSASSGIGLLGGGRLLGQLTQFLASVVLARLVSPADYGAFALVLVIGAAAAILNEGGLTQSLVRRAHLDIDFARAAFWLNFAMGAVLWILVAPFGIVAAQIFSSRELTWLLPLSSLVLVINTNVVQMAVLQRQRCFGRIAAVELAGAATNAVVAIGLAGLGLGSTGLAVGLLAGSSVVTAALWREVHLRPHRPQVSEMLAAAKTSYGNVSYALITWVSASVDTFSVGLVANTAALGNYNRAFNLSRMPSLFVGGTLNRVLFPIYAQADQEGRRDMWSRATTSCLLVLGPLAAMMSATAPSLIPLLYGDGWSDASLLLSILSWCIPALAVASTLGPFLVLLARQRVVLLTGALQAVVTALVIISGVPWGLTGIAIAVVSSAYVGQLPLIMTTMRLARIRVRLLLKVILVPAATTFGVYTTSLIFMKTSGALGLPLTWLTGTPLVLAVGIVTVRDWRSLLLRSLGRMRAMARRG